MRHIVKPSAVLALLAALTLTLICPAAAAQGTDGPLEQAAAYVIQTVPSPAPGSTGGEWAVLGLARSGAAVPQGWYEAYLNNLSQTLEENQGVLSQRKYTEYARAVLALTALGEDPRNFAGYDLLSPLLDYEQTVRQGVNGASFALIALDCGGYEAPEGLRQQYLQYLLDHQLSDGGWALSGGSADPDVTAMALQALVPYRDQEAACAQAVSSALDRLEALETSGAFLTAESYAQAVIAFCSLGSAPAQPLVDGLLSFQRTDGSFCHLQGGSADLMATEQGLCALAALARLEGGLSPLYQMTEEETAIPDTALEEFLPLLGQLLPLHILTAPFLPLLPAAAGALN